MLLSQAKEGQMIGISKAQRELRFWTVISWGIGTVLDGKGISIFVSGRFLKAAKKLEYDQVKIQNHVRAIAKECGYKVENYHNLIHFGDYGIQQIDHPSGGGCWMHLDLGSNIESQGSTFSTHNVDHLTQQSFLFAVWVWWANIVAIQVDKK